MHCNWVQERIGRYVDLELGVLAQALLRLHLAVCPKCFALYERSETLGRMLAGYPARRPPASLETRILSAFSLESLRRRHPDLSWQRRRIKLGNLLRPVAVPGLGGLLLALVLVPSLLSVVWMEPTAHADDVPVRFLAKPLVTAPVMALPSPYSVGRNLTVIAFIDDRGGVYDFRVANDDPIDSGMRRQLANALLTCKFEPAQRFGRPTAGHRVILFQRIESQA